MRKRFFSLFLALTLVVLGIYPVNPAQAATPVSISAPSAVLYDINSQKFIYSKTPHKKRAPASTTKILTAILAVENLSLDQVVTIPGFVSGIEPSKAYLRPGEQYYVRDLVRATLISSANDAAETLAHVIGGTRSDFTGMMNRKARQIGCRNSHFVRGSGLPAENQYSTAYDMSLIMRQAQKYPFIVSTMKYKTLSIQSLDGRRIYLKNHNKMLWRDHREVIGKTGWTRKARYCFVGQIGLSNRKVLVSFLGSHNLWRDLRKLVDYQFGFSLTKIRKNQKIWGRDETKKIQLALKHSGQNPGPIDGVFGSKTLSAVKKFQAAHSLKKDGIVGPSTWKKLQAYL